MTDVRESDARGPVAWVVVVTGLAGFIAMLDNLVVTTAIPTIGRNPGGGIDRLWWTVNAYILSFAVLQMLGVAAGDRFGRRGLFTGALAVFAPAAAASALAIATGPLIGGAIVGHLSWHWIFWLDVPIGLLLLPLTKRKLTEGHGPGTRLDAVGTILVGISLFGIIYGIVRGNADGWTNPRVLVGGIGGAALAPAFIVWELRTRKSMPIIVGVFLQACALGWIAAVSRAGVGYSDLWPGPVLAFVLIARGGTATTHSFVQGLVPSLWVGSGTVVLGGITMLFVRGRQPSSAYTFTVVEHRLSGSTDKVTAHPAGFATG